MQSIDAVSPGNWVPSDTGQEFQPDFCVNQVKWAEESTDVVFNWWAITVLSYPVLISVNASYLDSSLCRPFVTALQNGHSHADTNCHVRLEMSHVETQKF